jgi:methyl-accepting chemotaxis protein
VQKSAQKVAGLVGEIASASNEQAQGIEQVNRAMSEMDGVIQNVAANAEESAASSEEMNSQTLAMQETVDELMALVQGRSRRTGQGRAAQLEDKSNPIPLLERASKDGAPRKAVRDTADPEGDFADF